MKDLVRKFGDFTAVKSTSFSVKPGEIFGLLGPNGAGKTVTFRILCGLLPATSGLVQVDGLNLRTARAEARGHVGYVAQKFSLYRNLSVRENLEFFGGAYGLRGKHLEERIEHVIREFHLNADDIAGKVPAGMQRRLAIAAAMFGAGSVEGCDIDPLAIEASRFNAENNGVTGNFCLPDGIPAGKPYDIVIANILCNPLISLSPTLCGHVAEGGQLVLSGILDDQVDRIIEAFHKADPAITLSRWRSEEGWNVLSARRAASL